MKSELDKNNEWLAKQADLGQKYPNEYIAVANQEIIAHSKDFKVITEVVEKSGGDVLVDRVIPSDKVMIL